MRKRLEEAGLMNTVWVESAGMHGFHAGAPPDPRAVEAAARRGYSLEGHVARQIQPSDFTEFDIIIGMDFSYTTAMEKIRPYGCRAKIALLLDYAEHPPQREVPDPYYGGLDSFEYAIDLIELGVDGLLAHLSANPGESRRDG